MNGNKKGNVKQNVNMQNSKSINLNKFYKSFFDSVNKKSVKSS